MWWYNQHMSEPVSTEPYKGVRDFYPADWARLAGLFDRLRQTLAEWGYEEYNASPLERAELYEAKTSEEIVNEQTYTFLDRGARRVTLRPEMTPTLARMVAAKRRELPLPLRWYSVPNLFRYERPQKGRAREHYQLNVDLLGLPEGESDVEILRLVTKILADLGATDKDYIIRINSRALLNAACAAAGIKGEAAKRYLHLLDRKAKMPQAEFEAARRALTTTDPLAFIESSSDNAGVAAEKKKLLDLIELLKARGVGSATFDPTLTRGFDYYTGIIFEVFDRDPTNPRSLFGGGRYDDLVGLFSKRGDASMPAVGFGMGDITLADFLETRGLRVPARINAPQLYIGTPAPSDVPAAQVFADTLRKDGGRVFVNLTDRALGDQVKDAVKRGIPLFLAYGADERAGTTVRLKMLSSNEELALPVSELPAHLRGLTPSV